MKRVSTAILTLVLVQALAAQAENTPDMQYMPKGGYVSTTNAKYVAPSATKVIKVGQKIDQLTQRNMAGETIIQKLTARTYWAQVGFYNVVFYVGDNGVLLFDSLADGSGAAIIKAVQTVTKKPITALVYSHAHVDHIGDAPLIAKAAKEAGVNLRIIASDATAKKLAYINSVLPKPTETVAFDDGTFKFENLTVKAQGFVRAAHTDDSAAWLLTQEKVLHAPDMTNPDQMPYLGFGGSENSLYLAKNLQQIAKGDWEFFSGGHGNIGSHADITFMQTYLADLRAACGKALETVSAGDYFNAKMNNHQAAAAGWYEAMSTNATSQLRAKYGKYYGFEASVPHQADMVLDEMTSYK